eukprot:754578-Hanusia_phi.AAC.1
MQVLRRKERREEGGRDRQGKRGGEKDRKEGAREERKDQEVMIKIKMFQRVAEGEKLWRSINQ